MKTCLQETYEVASFYVSRLSFDVKTLFSQIRIMDT